MIMFLKFDFGAIEQELKNNQTCVVLGADLHYGTRGSTNMKGCYFCAEYINDFICTKIPCTVTRQALLLVGKK